MSYPKDTLLKRREVLGHLAGAGLAASCLLRPSGALGQDTPRDCAPPGIAKKTPKPYVTDPKLPVRVRKSAFDLSKAEVERLKAAYAALRKLTKTNAADPRGWLQQGHVHCWYCGGGTDHKAGEAIHGSWRFFPWHRAYLHFHERILCKLIGDNTFALPYWDWDSTGRQTFPSIYGDPNDASNPLFDMLRSAKPGAHINGQAVSVPIMNKTMNSKTNTIFMGSADNSGTMENSPHGPVHIWTGDTLMQSARNDMGVLSTAAQDPVFFAHHGNIDRLWSVWLGLSPQHKNFTDPSWLKQAWQFYDENEVWTQITIAQVLDTAASLRSTYEKPSVQPIWTFNQPQVASIAPETATREAPAAPLVVAGGQGNAVPLGTAPTTKTIALPQQQASILAEAASPTPRQFYLHVRGIEVPPDAQAMFNVFLGLPDATPSTPLTSPNFVGTVVVLAKSSEGHVHPPTNATFDVTDVLGAVKPDAKLSVTLVPMAAEGQAPEVSKATYKEVTIDQMS